MEVENEIDDKGHEEARNDYEGIYSKNRDTSQRSMATNRSISSFINVRMLPTKVMYLFWGGLIATYHPYLNPFFTSTGLSESQAGFITGMTFLSSSIAGPLWGVLVDYTNQRKSILVIMCFGSAASIFALPWVQQFEHEGTSNITSNKVNCSTNITTVDVIDGNRFSKGTLLYIFLAIATFGSIFSNVLPNYIDAIAMKVVKTGSKETSYGSQRIFGSIGSCIIAYLTGVAIDNYQLPGMSNYSVAFFFYLIFVLIQIPMTIFLIGQAGFEEGNVMERSRVDDVVNSMGSLHTIHIIPEGNSIVPDSTSIKNHLSFMFRKFDVIFFMATILISGLAFNMFIYFTILLVNKEMKISKSRVGFIFSCSSISNIILFPFSGRIIKLLGGPFPAMILGMISYSIRYMVMSYTRTYWVMLSIQLLQGFGFAVVWTAMMDHVYQISPNKIKVTMTLISQTVHFGVSPFLDNVIGGKIVELFGGRKLFRGTAIMCGVWSICMAGYVIYYRNKKQSVKDTLVKEDLCNQSNSKGNNILYADRGSGGTGEKLLDRAP